MLENVGGFLEMYEMALRNMLFFLFAALVYGGQVYTTIKNSES